jgi:transcriptional regulator
VSEPNGNLVQGTLDVLILKALQLEPMHGFGISRRIEQVSEGVFRVNPGSLLVAFQRLERSGLVKSEWRVTENNRRAKVYQLTAKGRASLEKDARHWTRRLAAFARLMESR